MQTFKKNQSKFRIGRKIEVIHKQNWFTHTVCPRSRNEVQCWHFQEMTNIATEKNSTIVFPLPLSMMKVEFDDTRWWVIALFENRCHNVDHQKIGWLFVIGTPLKNIYGTFLMQISMRMCVWGGWNTPVLKDTLYKRPCKPQKAKSFSSRVFISRKRRCSWRKGLWWNLSLRLHKEKTKEVVKM